MSKVVFDNIFLNIVLHPPSLLRLTLYYSSNIAGNFFLGNRSFTVRSHNRRGAIAAHSLTRSEENMLNNCFKVQSYKFQCCSL